MRLQILRKDQEPIQNYQHVFIEDGNIDLTQIVDNQCKSIVASDIFDSFSSTSRLELIKAMTSKLRIGGELVVGGTDGRVLAKMITNGSLDIEEASSVISNLRAVASANIVSEAIQQFGLRVMSATINGLHYEVKAVRG